MPSYARHNKSTEYKWVWQSPNGRIQHTYTPRLRLVMQLYMNRGWTTPRTVAKGETP